MCKCGSCGRGDFCPCMDFTYRIFDISFYSGDGFRKSRSSPYPKHYFNGSGCVDVCPPEITLQGDPVALFKVCKCDGPLCPPRENRVDYEKRLRRMLEEAPGTLCPSSSPPCAVAMDRGASGPPVDITNKIKVGEPQWVKDLTWHVSYDVRDDAGNTAVTATRTIEIREVSLADLEREVRRSQKSVATGAPKECPPQKPCDCPKSSGNPSGGEHAPLQCPAPATTLLLGHEILVIALVVLALFTYWLYCSASTSAPGPRYEYKDLTPRRDAQTPATTPLGQPSRSQPGGSAFSYSPSSLKSPQTPKF